jgi:PAS domain S-box-containing protein
MPAYIGAYFGWRPAVYLEGILKEHLVLARRIVEARAMTSTCGLNDHNGSPIVRSEATPDLQEVEMLRARVAALDTLVADRERVITEQARTLLAEREAFAAQKLLLESETQSCSDGIVSVEAGGRVIRANRALRQIWNLAEDALLPGSDIRVLGKCIYSQLGDPAPMRRAIERIVSEPSVPVAEQLVLRDGRVIHWKNAPIIDETGAHRGRISYYNDVSALAAAEQDAVVSEERVRAIIDGAHEAIVTLDYDGRIVDWNAAAEHIFGWPAAKVLWQCFDEVAVAIENQPHLRRWLETRASGTDIVGDWSELAFRRADGRPFPGECSVARKANGASIFTTIFVRDLTEAKHLEHELRQAQKLESVGRLASGIAHEMNTPVQFVNDSVHFVRSAASDLFALLEVFASAKAVIARTSPDTAQRMASAEEAADLEFLRENVPKALDRAISGLDRIATLVRGMKQFSHPDHAGKAPVDLNRAVEMSLTIACNEYKYVADLVTDFGEMPPVVCLASELNQVVLNIVVNAAHAIGDVVRNTAARGRIGVRTWHDASSAFISISDTGGGIPADIQDKVFEPFFTTKEVGRGTGQGLAIARAIVVEKHNGELTFTTEEGLGTTFLIRIPLDGSS